MFIKSKRNVQLGTRRWSDFTWFWAEAITKHYMYAQSWLDYIVDTSCVPSLWGAPPSPDKQSFVPILLRPSYGGVHSTDFLFSAYCYYCTQNYIVSTFCIVSLWVVKVFLPNSILCLFCFYNLFKCLENKFKMHFLFVKYERNLSYFFHNIPAA